MDETALLPDVPDMDAYRKIYKDPATWMPAMREICRREGLDAESLYAETSGTNPVFRVGRGPWIKLFPPLWPEDRIREQVGIRAVRDVEGLAAPRLLGEGALGDWRYLLLSHVEGQAIGAVWFDLGAADQLDLAEQIGDLMRRLHRADRAGCAPITEPWPAFLEARRQDTVPRNLGQGLPEGWRASLEAYVPEALAAVDRPLEPVFLHADLTDDHIFVQQRAARWHVTGLIDFGDAMVGDPLYEFAAPALFLAQRKPEVQRAMLRGYGLEDSAQIGDAIRAWTILHRFSVVRNAVRFCPAPAPTTLPEALDALWHR